MRGPAASRWSDARVRDDPFADLPDAAALRAALDRPFRRAIRLHPRRGGPSGWGALEPVPWAPAGRFHPDDVDPGSRLDYHTGCAYPQDASSQLPVVLLDPRPGEVVVDCCAAPGSKASQIGIALGDEGLLVCCDASAPRRAVLAENLARQGVACAVVTPLPLHRLAERSPGCADAVLVDAPCSGHEARSARQIARMAERQLALLADAARLTAPGGRLVYSTCTPYRAEDEGVVAGFLAAHAGWSVERTSAAGCDPDLAGLGALRLWPHRQGSEPFFACRLRAPPEGPRASLLGDLPEAVPDLRRWLPATPLTAWRRGDLLFMATTACAACALPTEARGLIVGRGTPLRPDPWGAQALIERGAAATTVTHAEALRLWAGEALPLGLPAGTLLRTAAGAPLGEAEAADGQVRLRLSSRLRRDGLR